MSGISLAPVGREKVQIPLTGTFTINLNLKRYVVGNTDVVRIVKDTSPVQDRHIG